jgi:hypothetical protein
MSAREQAILAVIELNNLVDPLNSHIEHPASSAIDLVSCQPRAASAWPSGPRIGAITASAIATGRVLS